MFQVKRAKWFPTIPVFLLFWDGSEEKACCSRVASPGSRKVQAGIFVSCCCFKTHSHAKDASSFPKKLTALLLLRQWAPLHYANFYLRGSSSERRGGKRKLFHELITPTACHHLGFLFAISVATSSPLYISIYSWRSLTTVQKRYPTWFRSPGNDLSASEIESMLLIIKKIQVSKLKATILCLPFLFFLALS